MSSSTNQPAVMIDPIHITRWGDSGPKVVLVHGSAQGGSVGGDHHFSRQEALGRRGWSVIVPDRPGHGRSPAPGRPDDAEIDGAWVSDLLGEGAHLVGHSFGGCVALAAAALRPERVRSLTLIEPGMQTLAMDDSRVRKFVMGLLFAKFFSISATSRARRFVKIAGIPADLRGDAGPDELRRIGEGLGKIRIPSKATLEAQLGVIKDAKIPLLTISGGWSPGIDQTAARVAALGGGKHRIIQSPHHFPQRISEEFNDALSRFMTESDAGAGGPSGS